MLQEKKQFRLARALGWIILVVVTLHLIVFCGCKGGDNRAPSGGPGQVTIRLKTINGQPVNAKWAAFQDGDGNWQVVNPTSQGVYQLQITDPAGRYGFAYVYRAGEVVDVVLLQATIGEASEVTLGYYEPETQFTVSGDLIEKQSDELIVAVFNDGYNAGPNVARYNVVVPMGIWDVVAWEKARESQREYATRIYIHRNLQVNGNVRHDVDLSDINKTCSLKLDYTLTIQGNPDVTKIDFITAGNTDVELARGEKQYASSLPYPAIPPELSQNGDLYFAFAKSYDGRRVIHVFSSPQNLTLQLPSSLTGVNLKGRALRDLRYRGVSWWEVEGDWKILVTSAWLGDSETYTIPDFSDLNGWNSEWNWSSANEVSAVVCNKTLRELAQARWTDEGLVLDGLQIKQARQWLSP